MERIAVLLTSFNRKDDTLRCLRALAAIPVPDGHCLNVYLVDDASSDGTAEAVRSDFPAVRLLHGDGNLFWVGGMRAAFAEAQRAGCEFYLWLNDDVVLFADAITKLIATYRGLTDRGEPRAIVVGSTCDAETGVLTYGGLRQSRRNPLNFERIEPNAAVPVVADAMNGNIVLVPKAAAEVVGNLDGLFTHCMADIDYSLRARRHGISTWICPGFLGKCQRNPKKKAWGHSTNSFRQRVKIVRSPHGLPPREWLPFAYRHAGLLGVFLALAGYRRVVFPIDP